MLFALYFAAKPYFNDFAIDFGDLNNVLIFMGLGISFSSLQDTSKTQNSFSRTIWEDPRKGKLFLILISFLVSFILIMGILGYFSSNDSKLKELSIGLIVLGIGMIGFLKASIEMFENHRKDKAVIESD